MARSTQTNIKPEVIPGAADGQRYIRSPEQDGMSNEQLVVQQVPRRGRTHPATWLVPMFFGLIWAIDAWFKWQPEFQHSFMKIVQGGAESQPSWLGSWYQFWQTSLRPYAPSLALVTAIVETIIAVALIVGFARKPLYIIGALWSLGIWAIPEGFGNTSRADYTDIGTSIIYVTVFAALWALDACTGPRRYSLDALIERYFPPWKRVAEVRDSRAVERRDRAASALPKTGEGHAGLTLRGPR
jgi:nitrite reductase (NO-forming)